MRILLTGGAGYIGSHVARECLRAGHEPVIFDSYVTGNAESVRGLVQIEGDLLDILSIRAAFEMFRFDAVLHFAAINPAPGSAQDRSASYRNSVGGTLNLVHAMQAAGAERLILSSTAAVYGSPVELPVSESCLPAPVNSCGHSMLVIERMLADIARKEALRYVTLRCFNAVGADSWGDIGEDHVEEPHLVPRLLLTALGRFERFEIFGTDYDTWDGTCVRDLVHVSDLARAHVRALEALDLYPNETFNLGSGNGWSVREVAAAAQRVTGEALPVTLANRRAGDPPAVVASREKARALLGWEPEHSDLRTILETAWSWHRQHPQGYRSVGEVAGTRQSDVVGESEA